MRERVFINTVIPGDISGRAKSPGESEYTFSGSSSGGRVFDSMVDVVTPNFHKLVASGVIVNNPMRRVKHETSGGFGTRSAIGKGVNAGGYNYMTGDIFGYISSADSFQGLGLTLDESNNALLDAFAGIDRTPYSFGEDLAEIKESLTFLRHPMLELRDLMRRYNELRRWHIFEGFNFLKAHAHAWAEVRFGAAPLLRSAYSLAEGIGKYKKIVKPVRQTSRGHAFVQDNDGDSKVFNGRRYMRYIEKSYDCRASVLYEQPSGTLSVNEYFGLRAKDIPETMWNVIPYSFMVDRFLNIDAVTRAYVNLFDPSIKILSACTVERRSQREMYSVIDDPSDIYTISWGCPPRLIINEETVRTPQPTNQAPMASFFLKKPLSSLVNLTDISALILQQVRYSKGG